MDQVYSVLDSGVACQLELFILNVEELRQYVVYVYYNIVEEPLYVGCSKSFYNAHYFNSQRLHFFDEVEYVGFVFLDNEENMKDAKKYYVKALNPKHNKHKYNDVMLLPDLDKQSNWLVVSKRQMEHIWTECLEDEEDLFGVSLREKVDSVTTELVRKSCGNGEFVPEWALDDWESQMGVEIPVDPFEPRRGRETVCHYFANMGTEDMKLAVQYKWAGRPAVLTQLSKLEEKFEKYGLYLVRDDFSILEADMLLAWVDDFDNLAKKPRFDHDYVLPFPDDLDEE